MTLSKSIILSAAGLILSQVAYAFDANVTPGLLNSVIRESETTDEVIKVVGRIDARDIVTLTEQDGRFKTIDLSDAEIVGFVSSYPVLFGQTVFLANTLPAYCFAGLQADEVILPAGITVISEGAFADSSVQSVVAGENVTEIGDFAFRGCTNLIGFDCSENLESIGKEAFAYSGLRLINLSSTKLTEISDGLFLNAYQLEGISFPSSIVKLGELAFAGTKINRLSTPRTTEVMPFALANMPELRTAGVDVSNTEEAVGLYFGDSNLYNQSLVVSGKVADAMFAGCSMIYTDDILGDVTEFGDYSLSKVQSATLVLPITLTYIGRGAFSNMIGLTQIDVKEFGPNVINVDENAFEGLNQPLIQLVVDEEDNVAAWQESPQWSKFDIIFDKSTSIVPTTDKGICVSYNDGVLNLSASENIEKVDVYSADGRILASVSPNSETVAVRINAASTTIVVTSSTAHLTQVDKLLVP